jgi:hypothetical protein
MQLIEYYVILKHLWDKACSFLLLLLIFIKRPFVISIGLVVLIHVDLLPVIVFFWEIPSSHANPRNNKQYLNIL